jgi:ABC-type nitrate/sulfonate/bicarbonate transport system permease component
MEVGRIGLYRRRAQCHQMRSRHQHRSADSGALAALECSRDHNSRKIDVVRKVGIPRSLPYLFASLKIAIALAFVGAVVSESIASNVGIGYLMLSASATFRIPLVFAGLLVIATMGIVMYMAASVLERRWASWATRGSEIGGYMGGG